MIRRNPIYLQKVNLLENNELVKAYNDKVIGQSISWLSYVLDSFKVVLWVMEVYRSRIYFQIMEILSHKTVNLRSSWTPLNEELYCLVSCYRTGVKRVIVQPLFDVPRNILFLTVLINSKKSNLMNLSKLRKLEVIGQLIYLIVWFSWMFLTVLID